MVLLSEHCSCYQLLLFNVDLEKKKPQLKGESYVLSKDLTEDYGLGISTQIALRSSSKDIRGESGGTGAPVLCHQLVSDSV